MVILVETFPSSVRQLPGGAVSSTIQGQTDRSQTTMQPIYCQQAVLQFPRINHYVCDRNRSFHIYNKTCCKDFSHDFSLWFRLLLLLLLPRLLVVCHFLVCSIYILLFFLALDDDADAYFLFGGEFHSIRFNPKLHL